MNPRLALTGILAAFAGAIMVVLLFADIDGPMPDSMPPFIVDPMAGLSNRKPCPDCGAFAIRIDEQQLRCQVCGCQFTSPE